jgi:WD40 repeat protein
VIVLSGKVKVVNRLQFSADGAELAASGWTGFQIWRQLTPGTRPRFFRNLSGIRQFTFLARAKRIYALGSELFDIDLEADTCDTLRWSPRIQQFALPPTADRLILREYLDERYLITCRETTPGHALVWKRADAFWGYQMFFLASGDQVLGVHKDPRRSDAWFAIYAVDSGEVVHRSAPLPEYSDETILSPDDSLLACLTRVRIRVYPVRKLFREPLAVLQNDVNRHFTGLAFHPSGRYLAATSNDATVKLYDTTTWEIARTFTWNVGRMRSVAFSPDGTLAAAGSDSGRVVVWDVDL